MKNWIEMVFRRSPHKDPTKDPEIEAQQIKSDATLQRVSRIMGATASSTKDLRASAERANQRLSGR